MILPLILLVIAVLAAAVVAYGTLPFWAQYSFGVDLIVFVRQFQWPLAALSIALCLAVAGLVVAGKRRAWWLVGLVPVLALFVHHFYRDPMRGLVVLDDPKFVPADQAKDLKEDDWVLGTVFNGQAYAYPYARVYFSPVVVQTEHDKRMVLIWNAYANTAVARVMSHDLHARDLKLVSMPANAVLVYETKYGQFINGITGMTLKDEKPTGLEAMVPVMKMRWKQWHEAHPGTLVMTPPPNARPGVASRPLEPSFPMPPATVYAGVADARTRVAVVSTERPIALITDKLDDRLVNAASPDMPLLLFRDPQSGRVKAFNRRVGDVALRFKPNQKKSQPKVFMIDQETRSGWNADGVAIEGKMATESRKLRPVPIMEGCYWGVMKLWMPELQIVDPTLAK